MSTYENRGINLQAQAAYQKPLAGYGRDQMTASELQSASQGSTLGGNASRSPLAAAADTLEQRLQHLQATIYRLGDRLTPVMLPPPAPNANECQPGFPATGAPIVDALTACSEQLRSMQQQVESLIDRLAI